MTARGAIPEMMPGDRPRRPLLHRIGERAGLGAALAALGLCCASAIVGPGVVAGAAGAVMGVAAGIVTGSAWLFVALGCAGAGAAAWLVVRHRRARP